MNAHVQLGFIYHLPIYQFIYGHSVTILLPATEHRIAKLGHVHVTLAQTLTVMRRQRDIDAVIHVEPFRMMIHLVRVQRHACHAKRGGRFISFHRSWYPSSIAHDVPPASFAYNPKASLKL